jgi:hypothetical protein
MHVSHAWRHWRYDTNTRTRRYAGNSRHARRPCGFGRGHSLGWQSQLNELRADHGANLRCSLYQRSGHGLDVCLGSKPTLGAAKTLSHLPPKADISFAPSGYAWVTMIGAAECGALQQVETLLSQNARLGTLLIEPLWQDVPGCQEYKPC